MKKTKIVCTIGPVTESVETLKELLNRGMNVMRLNFSHGDYEEHGTRIKNFRQAMSETGIRGGILLDTKGPEIRTMTLKDGKDVSIKAGQKFTFTTDQTVIGDSERVAVTYENFAKDLKVGDMVLVDDGLIELDVIEIKGNEVICIAKNNGDLGQKKGINLPNVSVNLPALSEKDIEDLKFGCQNNIDFVAASFIRKADDVRQVRKVLKENGGERIKIIAKIENQEGIENIESIIDAADGVMVARGDLAVEIPFEEAPFYQKQMIKVAKRLGKPVIVATQMLESMSSNPNPTRAEVSDVANAVYDVTSAVMLSGETAAGKYPVECVKAMDKIARNAEQHINYAKRLRLDEREYETLDDKIAEITVSTAHKIGADAIVTYTKTGRSVEKLAGFGAVSPILAITDDKKTYNQLSLIWNVTPLLVKSKETITKTIEEGIHIFKEKGIIENGDLLYLAGGREYLSGVKESKRIGGIVIA